MTTLVPLGILAVLIYAIGQTDDPITAGAVLLAALALAGMERRNRPHRSTDKLI